MLILHHHDPSPFAEKIRKVFGVKGLSWASVQIPMIVPKPDLTCLTGGYRGTPVLQLGADIYCDTRLIVEVLERLHPDPPLFTSGPLVNFGLQHWSDDAVFPPGAALAMHENAANLPDELLNERRAYFTNLDFSRFAEDADHFRAQFQAHAALIDEQLQDGRPFLLGMRRNGPISAPISISGWAAGIFRVRSALSPDWTAWPRGARAWTPSGPANGPISLLTRPSTSRGARVRFHWIAPRTSRMKPARRRATE
jgi:glutathione S-transferase